MIKVSAIHEAALLIAIHVGVVVSTVTLELQTMQYRPIYINFWLRRPPPDLDLGILIKFPPPSRVDAVISTPSISVDVQGSIGHGCYSLHVGGHRSPPCCAKNFCRKR